MIKTSKILEKSLWEYDIKKLNYDDKIVIIRALNFWEISDVKKIIKNIWKEKVIDTFKKYIWEIDNKSKNYWNIYFKLNNNINNLSMYEQINKPIFRRSFK